MPIVRMPGGTGANPRRQVVANGFCPHPFADIADVPGDTFPPWPVTSARAGEGMGDFVEENLMNLVVCHSHSKMS